MKNKTNMYTLLLSLLVSTMTIHASDKMEFHTKSEKMRHLRQYPNLDTKPADEIRAEINEAQRKYKHNGVAYFNNLKFEKASKDARKINQGYNQKTQKRSIPGANYVK